MRYVPHPYQTRAARWVEDHHRSLLFLDMGLGKSVITLTAIRHLVDWGEVERVLVVAPKKVAESTWSTEAAKWDHLRGLRVSVVMGTPRQRERALGTEAEVYVTGRDQVVWLLNAHGGRLPYDMVVLDELTSFKNPKSLRFKALKRGLAGVARVVGLTGTPTPNGLEDLWAQVYCVDGGQRLGRFITHYRERWFNTFTRNNIPIRVTPKPGAEREILSLIGDITLTMRAQDWLRLPPFMEETFPVMLPGKVLERYRVFERERVLEVERDSRGEITAASAAALVNKLSQFANGAVYDEERRVVEVHDAKLEAMAEILESERAGGVLCFYQFQHDRDRILSRFGALKPRVYSGASELEDWNAGRIRLLLAHPAATAFGLNMQAGGSTIIWFSTGWNLELYQQANARLYRQGQERPVRVFRLSAVGTVDGRMLEALDGKQSSQGAVLRALVKGLIT